MRVVVKTPHGSLGVFVVHMPTARYALEQLPDRSSPVLVSSAGVAAVRADIERRRQAAESVGQWVDTFDDAVLVLGDFNMPVDSAIYRQFWSDWTNAFSAAGFGLGRTKHTPMRALDGMLLGSRIDHILVRPGVRVTSCWVGPSMGSDHRSVCADLSVTSRHAAP
jgi:endonuclease/exonuclease/phosphatase (EEP) superfamily protein YafD